MTAYTYSFDIFDTCLVRTIARPTDLFFLLAERVLTDAIGPDVTTEEIVELARLRQDAEAKARTAASREDVTLEQIYQYVEHLDLWNLTPDRMMAAEIQLERELVRPVRVIREKIHALRQQGRRIIFISDMYLPRTVIHQMLQEHGLARPDDPVYVSGEAGLTKYSGKLFQYVLEQENLNPAQLWHCGDNPRSDVIVPAGLGIKTCFFRQSHLNRYERWLLQQAGDKPWLYSQLAGISRAVRLTLNRDTAPPGLTDLAASVIAPLLTGFVAWVLHDAHRRGIRRLYFVSRDGQILLKIARQLAEHTPAPECRYLYGSRQAWFLPSLTDLHPNRLDWLTLHSIAPRHLLRKLNLTPADLEPYLTEHGLPPAVWDSQLNPDELNRFWQVIKHPQVATLIRQRAETARQTSLAYFRQEGLCDPVPWALVDVGWTLKTQRALRVILSHSSAPPDVQGYYLALTRDRQPMTASGPYRAFLLEPDAPYLPAHPLFNHIRIFEQVFTMADHPTVVGYQQTGQQVEPVFADMPPDAHRARFVDTLQQVITACAAELAASGCLLRLESQELRHTTLKILGRFLTHPQCHEVSAIAGILVGDDQNESRRQPLARRLTMTDILYYTARLLRLKQSRDFSAGYAWLEGSAAISPWWIRLLFWPVMVIKVLKSHHIGRYLPYWWAAFRAKENL